MLINKRSLFFGVSASILFGCSKSTSSNIEQETGLIDVLMFGFLLILVVLILVLLVKNFILPKKRRRTNSSFAEREITNLSANSSTDYDSQVEINRLNSEIQRLQGELEENKEMLKKSDQENGQLRNDLTAIKLSHVPAFNIPVVPPNVVTEMPSKEKIVKYSKFADEKGVFPYTHLTSSDDGSCYYQLSIDEEKRTGQFEPIISELNMHSFKNNKIMLLFPYCEIVSALDFWSNIKVLEPGSLKPSDVEWIVENKCRIELV